MRHISIFCLILLFLLPASPNAQEASYPNDVFRAPLDITLTLSGTFCEVRGNHFHSGIDLRTKERKGLDVYAIADGYVARIKENPSGFGKAVYIQHANGYTSVYAHLKEFNPRLEKYVEKQQYKKETFSIDLRPGKSVLPVRKGEVIAQSGNSGSSGGPHLHFEIRDTESQEPINPLFFGFDIKDEQSPVIWNAIIYNLGEGKFGSQPHEVEIQRRSPGSYYVTGNPLQVNSRQIGFGLRTFDKSYGSGHYNGTYFLQLKVDGDTLYRFQGNRFAFSQTRYANAHIDYATEMKRGLTYQQLFTEPHDRFPAYATSTNRAILTLQNQREHEVTITAKDFYGNTSELTFQVTYNAENDRFSKEEVWYDKMLVPAHSSQFIASGLNIQFPARAVYDTVMMNYQRTQGGDALYTPVHKIHTFKAPLHKYFSLQVKPNGVPSVMRNKALIVYRKNQMANWQSKGGEWRGEYLQTHSRAFGQYSVMIDTMPPDIRPANFRQYQTISDKKTLQIKIDDDLAGIASYRAEVDGNWVLLEYDAKNDLLIYEIDERFPEGEHRFTLEVNDQVGNRSIFQTKLTR